MNNKVAEGNYRKFGADKTAEGMTFTFAGDKEDACAILLYDDALNVKERIEVPKEYCRGAVRSVCIGGLDARKLRYNYEINGEVFTDPYAEKITGRSKWNDRKRKENDYRICGGYEDLSYEWTKSGQPEIEKGKMVMYKLHVRGFTMDVGHKAAKKGTFAAMEEKIPYLKQLGVTTLELMPAYEFEELEHKKKQKLPEYLNWEEKEDDLMKPQIKEDAVKLNYWGYAKGFYFAPKASYGREKNTAKEFKHLVDVLHQNDMECVMEMYFEPEENQNLILDALRYWVAEYHMDGFHLIGDNIPITAIAQDLFLKRTKIFYHSLPEFVWTGKEKYPHLYLYNEEYLYAGRKLLNHQGGSLTEFCNQQKKQNANLGFVNFLANNNGFTLADVFSYCEKHNEENGEDNADGPNYNLSINCGAEGRTGRRYVKDLRRKHIYMAFCMLFFAQGVPLILAGDEFGNSQQGNNNAYCQDNKTGWVNWKNLLSENRQEQFVEKLSEFRREHPVIHMEQPMKFNDYLHKGCPDVSYHSDNAWVSAFPEEKAAFGVMYNGSYAKKEDGTFDDYIYIGYNFQTGVNELALPKLPDKKKWYCVMDTAKEEPFFEKDSLLENQHKIVTKPQSVIVLLGK